MTIAVGDRIPDVQVSIPTPDGPKQVKTGDVLGHGKVVLFAVPGAFTPTCSDFHLPGYVLRADELKGKGVETIACVSVNDAFVMEAWGRDRGVEDKVVLLADGSGEFTRAMGLDADLSGVGLGVRSRRYAAVIEDGVLRQLNVESGPGLDVSAVEKILEVV